jgi:hypothetical protein
MAAIAVALGALFAPTSVAASATSWAGRCEDGVTIRSGPHVSGQPLGLCYATHSVTIHELVEGDWVDCEDGPGRPTIANYWARMTDNTTGVSGYGTICYVHSA